MRAAGKSGIRIRTGLRLSASGLIACLATLSIAELPIATATGATPTPTWTQLDPATSPSARSGAAMAYDAGTGQLVLFGGSTSSSSFVNDTWTWNGTTWTQLNPATSPSARDGAAMAYDASTGQLVLFGGADTSGVLSDTWTWNGTTWTQLDPATSPPARGGAAMAYDPGTGELVLFGGSDGTGTANDTWTWDGTTWTQRLQSSASPSGRESASMAYDPDAGQLVLFGGFGASYGVYPDDTWNWNGTAWTQLNPATSPPGRGAATMAYDPDIGQLVLFGGYSAPTILNDTWDWNGSTWAQATPPTSPSIRTGASLAYDTGTAQLMLFGGSSDSTTELNDTWEYQPPQITTDTVAFNSEGGAAVASLSGADGSSITLPSDTYAGYTFDGWYTEASSGTKVGGAGSSYSVPVGGITLFAQWTANIDTVAFDSEGGAPVASLSGADGSSIALPSDTYAGYTFDGWYTSASSGTKVGGAGSSYSVPVGGITLCAQWTRNAPAPTPPPPTHGYWLVGSDGGIFTFGSAQFYGSTGSLHLQRPVVGIVPTADRGGYWLDASDGGVFSFGDTQFFGSIPGLGLHPAGSGLPNSLNAPIVGMVPSIDDRGYFMVASDGGVFAFGDAHFAGSCPGIGGCSGSAVAVMPDHSGDGYWVVTTTGSVYTFGDAPYFGAPGHGNVTSAVATPDGKGYWVLLSDGEVFGYGDAANLGSPSSANFYGPDAATAIFATSDGAGYWVSSALGAVFNFGDAPNDGGMSGAHLNGSIIAATGF